MRSPLILLASCLTLASCSPTNVSLEVTPYAAPGASSLQECSEFIAPLPPGADMGALRSKYGESLDLLDKCFTRHHGIIQSLPMSPAPALPDAGRAQFTPVKGDARA